MTAPSQYPLRGKPLAAKRDRRVSVSALSCPGIPAVACVFAFRSIRATGRAPAGTHSPVLRADHRRRRLARTYSRRLDAKTLRPRLIEIGRGEHGFARVGGEPRMPGQFTKPVGPCLHPVSQFVPVKASQSHFHFHPSTPGTVAAWGQFVSLQPTGKTQ